MKNITWRALFAASVDCHRTTSVISQKIGDFVTIAVRKSNLNDELIISTLNKVNWKTNIEHENIRGLNLAVFKLTTVQVTTLTL
jgi:hypothetical protein